MSHPHDPQLVGDEPAHPDSLEVIPSTTRREVVVHELSGHPSQCILLGDTLACQVIVEDRLGDEVSVLDTPVQALEQGCVLVISRFLPIS